MSIDEQAGDLIRIPILIDKEGTWFYRGAEMFRKDILKLFFEALGYDEENGYYIEMKGVRNYIEVEDRPFVVKAVMVEKRGHVIEDVRLLLNDDTEEPLEVETLRIGPDNVPYCSVKKGSFEARLSRAAYYQLAGHIEHDEERDDFFLLTNTGRLRIHCGVFAPAGRA